MNVYPGTLRVFTPFISRAVIPSSTQGSLVDIGDSLQYNELRGSPHIGKDYPPVELERDPHRSVKVTEPYSNCRRKAVRALRKGSCC